MLTKALAQHKVCGFVDAVALYVCVYLREGMSYVECLFVSLGVLAVSFSEGFHSS